MSDRLREELDEALGAELTLERELGGGGMSRVFLAHDRGLDRDIVVKVLMPELAGGLSTARFDREVRLVAGLQQANIVPVHASGVTPSGLPYYTMPFVEGESLRQRMEQGSFSISEVRSLLRDIARALAYAHARGVVHRDIKPENVLLSGGAAVVTDFGIAKALSAARPSPSGVTLTQAGVSLGTPSYMAPEQALADPDVDYRADLYAVGVVAYELLAGTPPFVADTVQRLVAAHVSALPAPITAQRGDIPPALAALVMQLLEKDPAHRPASAEVLLRQLDGDGDTPDVRTTTGRAVDLPLRASRRARWRQMFGLAGIVGSSLLVWLMTTQSRNANRAAGALAASTENTVAVLELENLSADASDAFMANGLTEEITSRLGNLPRIRVKGRSAVRALAPAVRADYSAIGRALGVRYVVEGSVRRTAGRVRVSVRLLGTERGFGIWNHDYDHDAADLLTLQAEIAADVATNIAGTLLPGEKERISSTGTSDRVAYEQFLRGNFELAGRNPAAVIRAIAQYEHAMSRDPGFTPAVARLAYAYAQFLDWGWTFPGLSRDTVLSRGLAYADRALTLDPESGDAWLARGYLLTFRYPDTFDGVENAFRRAITLRPDDAEAQHQYGWVLHEIGQDQQSLDAYQRALAIEPNRASTLRGIGFVHLLANRDREARVWFDSSTRADPEFYSSYGLRALARLRMGDLDGARADGATSLRLNPTDPLRGDFVLAMAKARAGDSTGGRRIAAGMRARLRQDAPAMWDAWYVALALAGSGDRAGAARVLDRIPLPARGVALRMAMRVRELDGVRPSRIP